MIKQENKKEQVIDILLYTFLCLFFMQYLTGCSFKVEFGYHGETGRDDRTQTVAKK